MVLGCCMCHSCILLHGFNHMTDVGVLESVAAQVVMLMAVAGMVGKIINGLLADRIGAKWAIALFLGLQAVMIPFFIEARQAPSFSTRGPSCSGWVLVGPCRSMPCSSGSISAHGPLGPS